MNKTLLPISCVMLICMVSLFLNLGCSPESVAGGGTEGGNTICGTLVNDDRSLSVNAKVYLLPSEFNPGIENLAASSICTTTEEDGGYVFDNTPQGEYSIQAQDTQNGKNTLITGIKVSGVDIDIPVDTLKDPGVMIVEIPDTTGNSAGYLYVSGTTIHVPVSGTSKFIAVNNVPAKQLPPICFVKQTDSIPDIIRYNVKINSNDTVFVRNTQWVHSRKLYLNTTKTGADVDEIVTDFPVVVRLNANNFDFPQAQANGRDIRFVLNDSVPLVHEIERWDVSAGHGEIWVRVDTIYGNDSTQFIMMYWGNPDTSDNFGEMTVFDIALGFQGVWHLDGNTDTVYDVTPNCFHGVRNGIITETSGMVGSGLLFEEPGAFIDMGDVLNAESSDLTISAWVKRSAIGLQTIMAKSDGGDPNSGYGWTLSFHTADQLHFFTASGGTFWGEDGVFDCWSKEELPVVDTTAWHFVAVVFDRSGKNECRLYIDGVEMTGGSNGEAAGVNVIKNEVSFRIGAEADGDYPWTGLIDECIVAHTIRSESWIRLCYSNQWPEDKLVKFEK